MEKNRSNKTINISLAILSILVMVLSTALYLQGRQISKLKESQESIEEIDRNTHTGTSQAERKEKGISTAASLTGEDEEKYKARIKKLESQIADMQVWQDYLEKNQKEDDEYAESESSNQPLTRTISDAQMDEILRRSYSSRYEDFIAENNYSSEVKEKLLDLYIERENKMRNELPSVNGFSGSLSQEEIQERVQKSKEINDDYEENLAALLSEEGAAALKDYEKTERERSFIRNFKKMLGDEELDKAQERELISLMYDDRLASEEEQRKKAMQNAQRYTFSGNQPDKETMEMMRKESYDRMKKLYGDYAQSAKNILSESQAQKFEGYVNMQKSSLDSAISSSTVIITRSAEKKDEE